MLRARRPSTLDDADRSQLRDPARKAGPGDDVDDPLDVLVGERRLLGETLVRRRAHHDATRLELAAQLGTLDLLACAGAREGSTCTVAGGAEGQLGRAGLAREHEARGAHAAGDEDG